MQLARDSPRLPVGDDAPLLQHHHAVGQPIHLFQPMLAHNHRRPQLAIDPVHRGQKVAGGNGIQLARGLVQDQHIGSSRHDRR